MKLAWTLLVTLALLVGAACSRKEEARIQADAPPPPAATATKPDAPPAPLPDVNLAAADMGGAVEEVTGYFGPGFTPSFKYTPEGRPGERTGQHLRSWIYRAQVERRLAGTHVEVGVCRRTDHGSRLDRGRRCRIRKRRLFRSSNVTLR